MISRVSSNNKGKQAKMKNSVKKQRPNKQKKKYKETENSVAGRSNMVYQHVQATP